MSTREGAIGASHHAQKLSALYKNALSWPALDKDELTESGRVVVAWTHNQGSLRREIERLGYGSSGRVVMENLASFTTSDVTRDYNRLLGDFNSWLNKGDNSHLKSRGFDTQFSEYKRYVEQRNPDYFQENYPQMKAILVHDVTGRVLYPPNAIKPDVARLFSTIYKEAGGPNSDYNLGAGGGGRSYDDSRGGGGRGQEQRSGGGVGGAWNRFANPEGGGGIIENLFKIGPKYRNQEPSRGNGFSNALDIAGGAWHRGELRASDSTYGSTKGGRSGRIDDDRGDAPRGRVSREDIDNEAGYRRDEEIRGRGSKGDGFGPPRPQAGERPPADSKTPVADAARYGTPASSTSRYGLGFEDEPAAPVMRGKAEPWPTKPDGTPAGSKAEPWPTKPDGTPAGSKAEPSLMREVGPETIPDYPAVELDMFNEPRRPPNPKDVITSQPLPPLQGVKSADDDLTPTKVDEPDPVEELLGAPEPTTPEATGMPRPLTPTGRPPKP